MYLDRLEYKKDSLRIFDGRCRLVSAAVLSALTVCTYDFFVLAAIILGCLALLGRELRITFLRLVPVNMMVLALWIPVVAGFSAGNVVLYTLRINGTALLYMCFVSPLRISLLASAMEALQVPSKLTALFILTCRSIFLLQGELGTALVSMRQRQGERGNFFRWRSLGAVIAAGIVRSVLRSRKVSLAMSLRGFDGAFPVMATFRWKPADSLLLGGAIAALIIILVREGMK